MAKPIKKELKIGAGLLVLAALFAGVLFNEYTLQQRLNDQDRQLDHINARLQPVPVTPTITVEPSPTASPSPTKKAVKNASNSAR